MRFYQTGLPAIDTPAAAVPPATGGGGSGDGGQATIPDVDLGGNTPEDQRLINEGIGLQIAPGQPVFAPGEMPVTQEEIDAFNAPSLLDSTSTADEIAQDLSNQQAMLNPTGGNIMDEVALTGGIPDTNIIAPSGDIFAEGDPLAEEKIDVVTQEDVDNPTNLLQKLGIPEDFDIKKALIDTGINLVVGAPITLIAEGLKAVLPQAEPTFTQRTLTDELGLTDDRKFAGDPTTSAFAGLNAFGQFGDPVKTAKDRIDTRLENKENKNYGPGDKFYDDTQTMIEEYNRVTNKLGDIDAITTGDAQIAEETIGTLPEITEARQKQGEYIQEIEQQKAVDTTTQRGRDEADKQKEETGVAKVETDYGTRYESSGGTFASAEEAAEKGDGPSGGGGKIVCTMMNESYGFGSFRNKIWMKFHKDLSPEYQKGYHKLFLPLVRIAKTNKIVKKILEHIAVQSTIDMRQATRGKIHLIGRVYRKILLPLCYWVGKYAK